MGFLGGLFGRSGDHEDGTKDRCVECGMVGGGHTGWCSASAAKAAPDAAPFPTDTGASGEPPPEESDDAAPRL